jgi:hypothetical protein
MKALLPVVALVAALSLSSGASAQQSGTADDAKALLRKAAIAVKADKAFALAKFDDPNGGFKDRDLYVFCFDRRSGTILAGQPATKGRDVRAFKDPTGKAFGREMFANVKDGDVIIVDYLFPKPNSTVPVAKVSFVEGLGDLRLRGRLLQHLRLCPVFRGLVANGQGTACLRRRHGARSAGISVRHMHQESR